MKPEEAFRVRLAELKDKCARWNVIFLWIVYSVAVCSALDFMDLAVKQVGSAEAAIRALAFALPMTTTIHPGAFVTICSQRTMFLLPMTFLVFVALLLASFVEPCLSAARYHAVLASAGKGEHVFFCNGPHLDVERTHDANFATFTPGIICSVNESEFSVEELFYSEIGWEIGDTHTQYMRATQQREAAFLVAKNGTKLKKVVDGSPEYHHLHQGHSPLQYIITAPIGCSCDGGALQGTNLSAVFISTVRIAPFVPPERPGLATTGFTANELGWGQDESPFKENWTTPFSARRFASTLTFHERGEYDGVAVQDSWVLWGLGNNYYLPKRPENVQSPFGFETAGLGYSESMRKASLREINETEGNLHLAENIFNSYDLVTRYLTEQELQRLKFRVITAVVWLVGTILLWCWGGRYRIWDLNDGSDMEAQLRFHTQAAEEEGRQLEMMRREEEDEFGAHTVPSLGSMSSGVFLLRVDEMQTEQHTQHSTTDTCLRFTLLFAMHIAAAALGVYGMTLLLSSQVYSVAFWGGMLLTDLCIKSTAAVICIDIALYSARGEGRRKGRGVS